MPGLGYQGRGGFASAEIPSSQQMLVLAPFAKAEYVTNTPAEQILPDHKVVMVLGDAKKLVQTLLYQLGPTSEIDKERALLELHLEHIFSKVLSSEWSNAESHQARFAGMTHSSNLSLILKELSALRGSGGFYLKSLEERLSAEVAAIKANVPKEEMVSMLAYQTLSQLLECPEPEKPFLYRVERVIRGNEIAEGGLVMPVQYKPGISAQELPAPYLPISQLAKIMTVFSVAIHNIMSCYVISNRETFELARQFSNAHGHTFDFAVYMRALFPEKFEPILRLYSDSRMEINSDPERVKKMIRLIRENRVEIPKVVARMIEIPQEELKLEELIALQIQIMPLVPFLVYHTTTLNVTQRRAGTADLAKGFRSASNRLQKDFSINFGELSTNSGSTIDLAEALFGVPLNYVKLAKNFDILKAEKEAQIANAI